MIAFLRGRLASIGEDAVVIDVGGVGYQALCAASTLGRLPRVGETVELHTELALRDDGITLYGFLDPGERVWFKLLQTVQGVGARVALAILGVLRPHELATVLAAGDKAALTRASGVGTRLAARICAELKDRAGVLPPVTGAAPTLSEAALQGPVEDALSALVNLGYGRADAYAAIARARAGHAEAPPVDTLIRESLKDLAR